MDERTETETNINENQNNNSIKDGIDLILKIIPILMFVFLVLNFIFNFGYFFRLGINFSAVLTIRDYYEGTASFLIVFIALYGGLLNTIAYARFLTLLINVFNLLATSFFLFQFKMFFAQTLCYINLRINKKNTFSDKRNVIIIKRELDNIKNEHLENQKECWQDIMQILGIVLATIYPIYVIWVQSYFISKKIFLIILIIYLFLVLVNIYFKVLKQRIVYSLMLILTILFLVGNLYFLKDFKNDQFYVKLKNGESYTVIRTLNQGILIRDISSVKFIKWENVECLEKSVKNLDFIDSTNYLLIGKQLNKIYNSIDKE